MNAPKPIEILLVEDNPGDIELTQEAFREANIADSLRVVKNGDEALDYLYQRGEYSNVARPDIILLDLNMPGKNGKEVLAIIKEDDALKDIPVIILTSSEAEQEITKSYKLHANAYIVKPLEYQQLLQIIRSVGLFWLSIARLSLVQGKRGHV